METKYIIICNDKILYYVDDEKMALDAINETVKSHVKRLEGPSLKVFSRILNEGKEIQIYNQYIGMFMNSSITKIATYNIVPVSKIKKDE